MSVFSLALEEGQGWDKDHVLTAVTVPRTA